MKLIFFKTKNKEQRQLLNKFLKSRLTLKIN